MQRNELKKLNGIIDKLTRAAKKSMKSKTDFATLTHNQNQKMFYPAFDTAGTKEQNS